MSEGAAVTHWWTKYGICRKLVKEYKENHKVSGDVDAVISHQQRRLKEAEVIMEHMQYSHRQIECKEEARQWLRREE